MFADYSGSAVVCLLRSASPAVVVQEGKKRMQDAGALRQGALVLISLLLCLFAVRAVSEAHRSREKGRLVRSLVRQYSVGLAGSDLMELNSEVAKPWPNDSLILEQWLAVQVSRGRNPREIHEGLVSLLKHQPPLSQAMQLSVQRWSDGLERWTRERLDTLSTGTHEALQRGRLRFLEAEGYSEVGLSYDAAVLYLWSASLLNRAIELGKADSDFPEALYLLGRIYLTLRHGLPKQFQGEQLLCACSDLYPSSIWASRANAARHMGNR
jgi:hypothetical protein